MSLHTWHDQGSCKPNNCATFTLNSHWGRANTGKKKKVLQLCVQGCFGLVQLFATLWPTRLLYQRGVLSKQEYWSALANTCCHTLLEHCISCCPSHQPPPPTRVPGAARTPETQEAVPPPTWPSQGQTQALQGSLRSKTPVDNPHVEVEIKPQLKPRGSVAKEEDPKPSHQL